MRGSVVKRGSTFSIVYDLGRDNSGKRHQKWEGGYNTRKAAEKALRERISEIEGSFVIKRENAPVSAYLDFWMNDYETKELAFSTVLTYRGVIERNISPYIGNIQLCKLTPEDVAFMYSSLSNRGLSPTSILQVHRILNSAFNFAVRRRLLPHNVVQFVNPPRKGKYTPLVLDENQLIKLISICDGTEVHIPVLLAAMCGMRRGEILALMWDDIDLVNGKILVQRNSKYHNGKKHLIPPKSNASNRLIMIPSAVCSLLSNKRDSQQKCSDSPFVVLCNNGADMNESYLQRRYRSLVDSHDLPPVRFHDLRHSYATYLLKSGVQSKIVSEMLGHSSIGITLDLYAHVLYDMQSPATDAISNLMQKKDTYTDKR